MGPSSRMSKESRRPCGRLVARSGLPYPRKRLPRVPSLSITSGGVTLPLAVNDPHGNRSTASPSVQLGAHLALTGSPT
eukprot:9014746-Lingulodinium_polyedra.AAC.1